MKVICINKCIVLNDYPPLIIGKVYDVDRSDIYPNRFILLSNTGRYVPSELFVTIEEYRELQLNKLLNESN